MKKLLVFILFIMLVFSIGYSNSAKNEIKNDLVLQNIEALASGETSGTPLKCWKNISDAGPNTQTHVTYCGDCSATLARSWSTEGQCMSK